MNSGIKIDVKFEDDGDGLYLYAILINNNLTSVYHEFWGYSDEFKEFAIGLVGFPQDIDHKISYVSKESGPGAQYLSLNTFCYKSNGEAVIHITSDNTKEIPQRQKSEFYIDANAASLNKLGVFLNSFDPAKKQSVIWYAEA